MLPPLRPADHQWSFANDERLSLGSTAMANWIPFNVPSACGRELELVSESLSSGLTSAGGSFSQQASSMLAQATDSHEVILTTSCTDALELAALMMDFDDGDVVIVPSFTFVSTALAFTRAGASVRFADVDPVTMGVSAETVEPLLDEQVRAIVPVHYAGIAVDLDPLVDLANQHDIPIIEDNAHGLFGSYRDRPLGSFGRFAALSFHETKNFTCGEGGALVLNDPADIDRAHVLSDKGTNRRDFTRGAVDHYTWTDTGSSFRLSDLLAAFLVGQLERSDHILELRRNAWEHYHHRLAPHADELGYQCPIVPPDRIPSWHLYSVLLDSRSTRDQTIELLHRQGIEAAFHYVPLHSSPAGSRLSNGRQACPVTEDLAHRLLRLPFFTSITPPQVDRTCDAFLASLRDRI